MNNVATATAPPVVTYACQVLSITALSAETFQVDLEAPAGTVLDYRAGQYLQLRLDLNRNGQLQPLFYSIANGFNPEQPRRLQLFIQHGGERASQVLKHLTEKANNNGSITLTLPMGRAYLQTDLTLPHVLIAAGSGISKIKCIAEAIMRQQPDAVVHIYWSNKKADDFYLLDVFHDWVEQNKYFTFTPILESANQHWAGRSGFIYQVIKKDFLNPTFDALNGTRFYLCGSPNGVYGTIDQLKPLGLKEENCYSDVFAFSPRGLAVTA